MGGGEAERVHVAGVQPRTAVEPGSFGERRPEARIERRRSDCRQGQREEADGHGANYCDRGAGPRVPGAADKVPVLASAARTAT